MGNSRHFDDSADVLALLTGHDGVVNNRDARQKFAASFGMTKILLSPELRSATSRSNAHGFKAEPKSAA